MRRIPSPLSPAAILVVLAGMAACAKPAEPGDPLPGLTKEQGDRFERGRVEFERVFTPETGLGPLFNADSCAECHEDPLAGGTGDEVELHVTLFDTESRFCDPLVVKGGPVIQQRATLALREALGIEGEPVPGGAQGRRTTPDVLGFGLLDAVPESTLLKLADPDDRDGDGISGRPNRFLDGRIGRFGRKAFVPTLREFNEGAFALEQGITTPGIPVEETIGGGSIPAGVDPVPEPEIGAEAVDLTDIFVRLSAPPAPRSPSSKAKKGSAIFSSIGCAACHVPALRTGDHPMKALRYRDVRAYTDLLLHDMGEELADICLGEAGPSEFRTEPLMGLSLSETFLHDGRAKTIEEATRLHGGEASASRVKFEALKREDRERLLEFLKSL